MLSASSHPFHLGHFWLAWDAWAGFGPRGVKPLTFWVGDGRHALVILDYQLNDVNACVWSNSKCVLAQLPVCVIITSHCFCEQPFVFVPHISDHAIVKPHVFFQIKMEMIKTGHPQNRNFKRINMTSQSFCNSHKHLTRDWNAGMRDTRTHGGQANQDWPLYPTSLGITGTHVIFTFNQTKIYRNFLVAL